MKNQEKIYFKGKKYEIVDDYGYFIFKNYDEALNEFKKIFRVEEEEVFNAKSENDLWILVNSEKGETFHLTIPKNCLEVIYSDPGSDDYFYYIKKNCH